MILHCMYWRISTTASEVDIRFRVMSATCWSNTCYNPCSVSLLSLPAAFSSSPVISLAFSHLTCHLTCKAPQTMFSCPHVSKCCFREARVQQGRSSQYMMRFYIQKTLTHLRAQFITQLDGGMCSSCQLLEGPCNISAWSLWSSDRLTSPSLLLQRAWEGPQHSSSSQRPQCRAGDYSNQSRYSVGRGISQDCFSLLANVTSL